MKRTVLILLGVLLFGSVHAQTGALKAVLTDVETGEGVPGAVVEIAPAKYPDKKKYHTSGYNGALTVGSLPYGDYRLKATFLGYEDAQIDFSISGATKNIGKIEMKPSSTRIETVVKEVQALRTSQKGDTVSYNAGAFKVASDADVEGLLKKMPGITISNGEVEAQGESVKKVFVDGKEFFGEDVTSAIKSLPAQAVERVEVYNKLSDQAEFSGMDDGEGYKAINIVTRENMRQGQFGKVYAGYGYDADTKTEAKNKYVVGGNVNIFSGSSRLSVIGLFNNINQQNFSFEDILGVSGNSGGRPGRGVGQYMVRPQAGVATVNALGVNFSDTWGKREQVKFQGSYFFNNTRTRNRSTLEKWYEDPSPADTLYQEGSSLTTNFNHRFNAKIDWKISENQSIMSRTNFSYQSNDPWSRTDGNQWGESGYSTLFTEQDATSSAYNIREFLQYRAKLGKAGRTLTLDAYVNYSDKKNRTSNWSNLAEASPTLPYPLIDTLYQWINAPTSSYRVQGNVTYTEPVARYAQMSLQYRASYEYQERDKRSYIENEENALEQDASLSNGYRSGYMIHRVGPGFRFAKERNTLIANVYYESSSLDGRTFFPSEDKIRHSYDNFTYFLMGNLQINRENTLRLFVRSWTDNPDVTDLQNVYDVANPQYISKGNPLLNPSYTHNVSFHYVNSNVTKGRTFMWMFTLRNTSDYVATSVRYNAEVDVDGIRYRPLQYTEPINMDGYWMLRTHLSYGMPLSFMKCNLNLMAGVSYTLTPSMIDGMRNDASNIGYDTNVVLGSNISENIDFTLSWMGTYNEARNSLAGSGSKNRYFNHTASAAVKFVFWKGFTFTGSASYTQYVGFTNDYNDEYLLCNLYLGKKIFRNQRGEIQIGVNDLLNQNRAFVRTTGSGFTQNAMNSVIGRYYTVQFVYNLRHFGKRGSKNIKDYDGAETRSTSGVGMTGGGVRRFGPPMHR